MSEKVIEDLFKKISSHFDVVPKEAKEFFAMFITETLAYRDELVANGEDPLTVDEVQKALNLLETVLAAKKLPSEKVPPRIDVLLKRWIVKLNETNINPEI